MSITDSRENLERMAFMRRVIEKAIIPYRDNTEAALVVGALFQVARVLLRLYPPKMQEELLEGAFAYLKGEGVNQAELPVERLIEPWIKLN